MMTLPQGAEAVRVRAAEVAQALAPGAAARESSHDIPGEVIARLAKAGLLGVNVPRALGGAQAGVLAYAAALREIARADASVAVTMAVTNMVAEVIVRFGSDAQRDQAVPKLVRGEYFGGAFGLSEPGAGSDAASLRTKAERDGDHWVITGEKLWITTGDRAGVVVVWARTGGPGPKGISAFLVPGGAPGLTSGKPEDKMGLLASHTVTLSLDRVRGPYEALLGREGAGFAIAMAALDGGRIGIASQALGIAQGAYDTARAGLLEGASVVVLAEQARVQTRLATMATELDAAWLLVLRAAALKERGEARFSREAAMAKVFATEAANRVIRDALALLGPRGYREDVGVARALRDCRVTQIYEGTSEIQRVVIAREILRGVT